MAKKIKNEKTNNKSEITPREVIMEKIRNISPLTDQQTSALLEHVAAGKNAPEGSSEYSMARDAVQTLAHHNIRLAMNIANTFKPDDEMFEDLLQEGYIILCDIIPSFDASKGFKFSTYAGNCLHHGLKDYFNKVTHHMSIPRGVPAEIHKVNKAISELDIKNRDDDSLLKVAEATGFTLKKVKDLLSVQYSFVSIDKDGDNEEVNTICEKVADTTSDTIDDVIDKLAFSDTLQAMYSFLSKREALIFILHLGLEGNDEYKKKAIAERMKLSVQTVRNDYNSARKKLKENPYVQQIFAE